MEIVRVAYSRIYNARGFSLSGREEVHFKFSLEAIDVVANIGPNLRHIILSYTIGPERPIVAGADSRISRAQGHALPSPEEFPADIYTELVASEPLAWISTARN